MREDELDGSDGYGVRMNKTLKKAMAIAFSIVLTRENFKWWKDFTTNTTKMTPNDMKEEIMKQMKDYCVILKKPTRDPFAPPTEIYSGKSGYGYDDLMIAIQLANIMQKRFVTCKEKYSRYW